MQHVFVPGFSKISELVQQQIRKVESKEKEGIKVDQSFAAFTQSLVGGFSGWGPRVNSLPCKLHHNPHHNEHRGDAASRRQL